MADGTAAIVWGLPVKIIDLLGHLDVFKAALPAIRTLRLCNQFGKGEDVHINKLPKELVTLVEEQIIKKYRSDMCWDENWQREYCCFEGSCRPSEHYVDSAYMQLREDAMDIICEEHDEYDLEAMRESDEDYPAEFEELVENKMDELCDEFEEHFSVICESKASWGSLFKRSKAPRFKPYEELLRKHFGLEPFVMHENLDETTSGYIARNDKRFRKDSPPEQATVCYLVLPTQLSKWRARLDPETYDVPWGHSGKSMLVSPDSLVLTESHKTRFTRAMRELRLHPSVHPSQLHGTLSAFSPDHGYNSLKEPPPSQPEDLSPEELAKRDAEITKRIKGLEEGQWPKLMLLIDEDINDGC